MSPQQDLQELIRLLTTGRNKVPMLVAMMRVKALQFASLHSISDIASTDLPTLQSLLNDERSAKSLLAACKAHTKNPESKKRPAGDSLSSTSKRSKSAYELSGTPQTPQEFEKSLELPQPSQDEKRIESTRIWTNRAPLVLAFAVQLLKYTMPEQPLSGRLSLAQTVVSLNSRSKAVSLGIESKKVEEGWGSGQPKVRVLGREVAVLKRSGYDSREEEEDVEQMNKRIEKHEDLKVEGGGRQDLHETTSQEKIDWSISSPIISKNSKFIARAISITSPTHAKTLLQTLLSDPSLRSADHNITAFRAQGSYGIIEESQDDGESGGGRHILRILQSSNLTNVLLVVTRWYGGIMLGPDRWRIMSEVSRDALSQRLRVTGIVGRDALWGLDLESSSSSALVTGNGSGNGAGLPIHRPEGARNYILRAFATPEVLENGDGKQKKKKKTAAEAEREKEENLGLLLGALDLLFKSWVEWIGKEELDRRAWGWYVSVRPDVENGVAGWGGKGEVKLSDILNLRRKG